MTESVSDVARHDPRRIHDLYLCLETLAQGPAERLREMANAVLKGELSLRDAALSDAYGTCLGQAFEGFWIWYQDLGPEEREAMTAAPDESDNGQG